MPGKVLKTQVAVKNREFRRKKKAEGKKLDRSGRIVPKNPNYDRAMKDFWKGVTAEEMASVLEQDGQENAKELAKRIRNPLYKGTLAEACRECDITLNRLNDLWRKYNLEKGLLQASNHLPKILEDTAIDAESRFEICPRCDGLGSIVRYDAKGKETQDGCPQCRGTKEIRISGDGKARDQIFETFGLTGKHGGPLVAIQQNIETDSLEGTLKLAQKLIERGDVQ